MRNSRGGLGDIPSPGRTGAPPAFVRFHLAKSAMLAKGDRGIRESAMQRSYIEVHRAHDVAAVVCALTHGPVSKCAWCRPDLWPLRTININLGFLRLSGYGRAPLSRLVPACAKPSGANLGAMSARQDSVYREEGLPRARGDLFQKTGSRAIAAHPIRRLLG